jgi:hypothetical protein
MICELCGYRVVLELGATVCDDCGGELVTNLTGSDATIRPA